MTLEGTGGHEPQAEATMAAPSKLAPASTCLRPIQRLWECPLGNWPLLCGSHALATQTLVCREPPAGGSWPFSDHCDARCLVSRKEPRLKGVSPRSSPAKTRSRGSVDAALLDL